MGKMVFVSDCVKEINENLNRMEDESHESTETQKVTDAMISGIIGIMAFQVISNIFNDDEEHEKRRTGFGKFRKRKKTNNNMDRIL